MSSWAQQCQPANLVKQPPQSVPLLQQQPPQQVGVVGSSVHSNTAPFGSQPAWPQNYTQQPMQPVQQPPPNNWTPNPLGNYPQQNMVAPQLPQPVQLNNWPHQDLHLPAASGPPQSTLPTSGYFLNQDNFMQPQQQQQYPNMPQSYPPPQQYPQNSQQPVEVPTAGPVTAVNYSRQSTQTMDNAMEAPEFFDNKINNNNDGWGDWDWNDNNAHHQQQRHQQQPPKTDTLQNNSNTIDDSFRTEANDNWQWGPIEEINPQQNNLILDDLHQNSQQPPPQEPIEKTVPPPPANFNGANISVPPPQQKEIAMQSALTGIQHQAVHSSPVVVKPTNLPLSDASQSSEAAQNNNNIPSPVYVSQAKPVSKPPRQYASLPGATNDVVNVIGPTTPPHAFQNRPEPQPPSIAAVAGPPPLSATLPPPVKTTNHTVTPASNPFKRAGLAQHHRAGIVAAPLNSQQPSVVLPPAQFYATPPPPPEDFANPSVENHEVIAPDNSEIVHENQEIAPNNDRNEYLQTSHLSEISGHADATFNIEMQELNNESDDFPPPGLSRLVLGQPENESRQVPGTVNDNSLNIERQADGEDTDLTPQRSTFTPSADGQSNVSPNQIDITADRNLYLVPGESDVHELRVVTGLENGSFAVAPVPPIQVEQREVELDGENIEDQQQPPPPLQTSQHHHSHHHHHRPVSPVQTSRDEPLEGANSLDRQVQGSQHTNHETESSMTVETNVKDLSNISTGNEESDQRDRHYGKSRRGGGDDNKKRRPGNELKEKRYESEESDYSSDRERHRYREGSVRSERDRDRDSKERKRNDKREREIAADRDRDRYRGSDRENKYRDKYYRDREGKLERSGRYGSGRYDADSKYETEGSTRHDRRRGGDRSERSDRVDREAYEEQRRYRKYNPRDDRDNHDRRSGGRSDVDRRRNDRDYRDDRDLRRNKDHREKPARNEYEEYRKTSSRNVREVDADKESRLRDKDPRYAAHGMYSGYSGYGYDPYAAYYYEQMVRTNPQAYSEWYKKYYGQAQAPESITNDGRESVHSGRSSAHNEKDRYTVQHHQYIPYSNDYHQHFVQPAASNMSISLNSTMIESQLQLQQQQQQQQQQHQGGSYSLSGGRSTGNLSQINQLPTVGYYPSTARSSYARSEYSESRRDHLADSIHSSMQQDPQRLTPYKFTNDHPIISLGPGVMVAVKPKYSTNGITNVVKIFKMGANDATNKLFQSFPGPLVRGITHKKTIIEFCEDQIRLGPFSAINCSRQNSMNSLSLAGQASKPSFTLMWNLLILLLRQNGMVVGTDIAELLIKNQQQFPYETPQSSVASSSNRRESLQSDEQRKSKENTPSDGEQEVDDLLTDDRNESDLTASTSLTEEEITEKFRNYLLYGNVNEALDWATDNNLWGHALFLASKVDRRSHANVMMKFANKLSLNDPLQTLYQLMSGRTPSSVTSVQDEKWGDWRPHLAMILSNTSQKPDLDRKAITTLGDSLFNRGDLFAAHFCYLMAQVGFSKYPEEQNESLMMQNSVRLVLLGSSHHRAFEEFATNESIMMTEVYEYACSLNDDKFSLVEFQPYKFLLATRMLDYGHQLKCLMYMEQISLHIQRDPTKYEPIFINQIYELADRLKYCDPVLEKSMDEVQMDGSPSHSDGVPFEEQKWLLELRSLAAEYMDTTPSQELNDGYQQTSNVIDQQFSEINRQFNELNLQYSNNSGSSVQEQHQPSQIESTEVQYNAQPDSGTQVPPTNEQQYPQFYNPTEVHQTPAAAPDGGYGNGYMQPVEPYQQTQQPHSVQQQTLYDQSQTQAYPSYGHDEQQQQQQNSYEYWGNQAQIQNEEHDDKSCPKSTSVSDNIDSVGSTIKSKSNPANGTPLNTSSPCTTQPKTDVISSPTCVVESTKRQQKQQFKSFNFTPIERNAKAKHDSINNSKVNSPTSPGAKQQQPYLTNTDTARPTISMPNSLSQKSGFYEESRNDGSAIKANDAKKTSQQGSSKGGINGDSKNQIKGGQSSNQNSGWFGGIWNKLSLKPKNQMILPDDKNPAIVWDPEKKKWVNTDGEVEGEENLKPPPKMSDLMPRTQANFQPPQQQQQLHQPPQKHEEIPQQMPLQPPQPIPSPGPVQSYSATSSSTAQMPGEPAKPPSLQSNMFKMQRNRTLKNSYVDVFNPSGAAPKPTEQVLAPVVPPAAVPVGGFFVPGATPNDGTYQQHSAAPDGAPQFYNPNQFGGYQQ